MLRAAKFKFHGLDLNLVVYVELVISTRCSECNVYSDMYIGTLKPFTMTWVGLRWLVVSSTLNCGVRIYRGWLVSTIRLLEP